MAPHRPIAVLPIYGEVAPKAPEGLARYTDRAVSLDKMLRAICACIVAAFLLVGCNQVPPPPLIMVPNVVGQPLSQAEA